MLTNGTTIAATDQQSVMLEQMLGIPAQFGRGTILGSVPVPERLLTGNPEIDDVAEAYVVQPQDSDGNDLTDAEAPGAADWAFVVVRVPEQYGTREVAGHPELGEVPVTLTVDQISKSQFLASVEAQDTAAVDQFTEALASGDFERALASLESQFEAPADDEWCADDDEPGSDFTD